MTRLEARRLLTLWREQGAEDYKNIPLKLLCEIRDSDPNDKYQFWARDALKLISAEIKGGMPNGSTTAEGK